MAKDKITHIFNKNHIEILKIERGKGSCVDKLPTRKLIVTGNNHRGYPYKSTEKKVVEEKKVSPLGFYYTSKKEVFVDNSNNNNGQRTIVVLTVPFDERTEYQMKFYTRYDDNFVVASEDGPRPWDICKGDGDFSDNMLHALVTECDKFFTMMEEKKMTEVVEKEYFNGTKTTPLKEIKNDIYRDLFGNANGPRFQTDMDKIIAHGFDPKYSFRKDKEAK